MAWYAGHRASRARTARCAATRRRSKSSGGVLGEGGPGAELLDAGGRVVEKKGDFVFIGEERVLVLTVAARRSHGCRRQLANWLWACSTAPPPAPSTDAGALSSRRSVITISAYSPGTVSTRIVPWWPWTTISRLIDRPSSVPWPEGLVVKKGSKSRSSTSGRMPGPLSRMRISIWSPWPSVRTRSSAT